MAKKIKSSQPIILIRQSYMVSAEAYMKSRRPLQRGFEIYYYFILKQWIWNGMKNKKAVLSDSFLLDHNIYDRTRRSITYLFQQ